MCFPWWDWGGYERKGWWRENRLQEEGGRRGRKRKGEKQDQRSKRPKEQSLRRVTVRRRGRGEKGRERWREVEGRERARKVRTRHGTGKLREVSLCAQVCVHVCAQRSRLRAIIMTKTERKKPGNRGSQREDSPKI